MKCEICKKDSSWCDCDELLYKKMIEYVVVPCVVMILTAIVVFITYLQIKYK